MLSPEHNELVSKVGPGTPMGELMRQYWIPALMSSELDGPDCRPARVRLLCEDLIAFRATSGEIGIMRHACPHRGASLFFGRNEEEGLRCVYHGWKFDVAGKCVDMPNEPPESNFKDKVHAVAYPARERNGVVWVYMGQRETPPPLSDFEANMLPDSRVWLTMRECNWLQALEGDIDTSHFGFLHMGSVDPEQTQPGTFNFYTVKDRAPRYSVVDTEFGTMYGAYRPAEEDTNYWRVANFLFPFFAQVPPGVLGIKVELRAWVPLDDDHTMFWSLTMPSRRYGAGGPPRAALGGQVASGSDPNRYLPNTNDWLGRWRLKANPRNDYLLDPVAQKTTSYTGIAEIFTQDQAVTESMGRLMDRSREHLGTADAMVIRTRQRLLKAALAWRDEGIVPPGVDTPEVFRVRSGGALLPKDADWLQATAELRRAFVEHPDLRAQAEAGRF